MGAGALPVGQIEAALTLRERHSSYMEQAHTPSQVAQLLNSSDWDGFVAAVKVLDQDEQDALLAGLGGLHGSAIDLIACLRGVPEQKLLPTRYLVAALTNANLPRQDIVRLLHLCTELTGSLRFRLSDVLRAAIAKRPAEAATTHEDVMQDPALRPVVDVWVAALSHALPTQAVEVATALPTDSPEARRVLALFAEQFKPELPVLAALKSHESRILAALLQDAPTTGLAYSLHWAAIRALAAFYVPAMQALLDAVTSGQPPATIALAAWLPRVNALEVGATKLPMSDALRLVLDQAKENAELMERFVDDEVSALFYQESTRPIVVSSIQQLETIDGDVAGMFGDVFGALADNRDDFIRTLTAWLLSPAAKLTAVRSVLAMCASKTAPIGLDAILFMAASAERQVVACRRLLNLVMDGEALCTFISVLAEDSALQPQGLAYASEMLPAAMDEYPGATEDFLRAKTRQTQRQLPFAHLYRVVLARALQWRRVLKRLPARGELQPTASEQQALRGMRHRRAQSIMRSAREQSVFAALATTVHTAQGRRFVTHTERGPTGISSMAAHSHSIELPASELSDPLGALVRRRGALSRSR